MVIGGNMSKEKDTFYGVPVVKCGNHGAKSFIYLPECRKGVRSMMKAYPPKMYAPVFCRECYAYFMKQIVFGGDGPEQESGTDERKAF